MRDRNLLSPDSYGLVLVLVGATYLIASYGGSEANPSGVVIQIVTALFALRTSRADRRVRITVDGLLIVAIVALAVGLLTEGDTSSTITLSASAMLYIVTPIVIIRHLAVRPTVDLQTLLGAVAAYVMVGMVFAFGYELVALQQSSSFFGAQGDGTPSDIFFFSFTTLTTTGYGNLVPAANPGRNLAVTEMLIGQLFLVTVVAKVVTSWAPRR
jgi:hypothetical protein